MAEQDDIRRQERIEAYVGGKLAGEELRAFEAELAADAQLQRDVEVERTLAETLQRSPELRFRDLVQRVSDDQERGASGGGGAEKPVIPIDRGRMRWWAAAAGVAVVLGIAVLYFDHGTRPDYAQFAYTEVEIDGYRNLVTADVVDSVFAILQARYEVELSRKAFTTDLSSKLEKAIEDPMFDARYGDKARPMWARTRLAQDDFQGALAIVQGMDDAAQHRCEVRFIRAVALLGVGERDAAERLLNGASCTFPEKDVRRMLHTE